MLGFKIFDSDPTELTDSLIKLAHNENLALEIALYGDNIDGFTQRVTQDPLYVQNNNKSIHFNYRKHVVNNIKEEKHYNNLIAEIKQAKDLLINRGVIHYQYAGHTQTHLENLTPEAIKKNLSILYSVAKAHDIVFYIENTYIHQRRYFMNELQHHRIIWDTILELGFQDHIGICLDWGHVKAFSGDSLIGWIDYVKELKQNGLPVYMHVHDNDAKKDLHDSLKIGHEIQHYLVNNPSDKPYLEILGDIQDYFEDDSLILEYQASIAEEHFVWTKSHLNIESK
jgi:sugar phosphate isomerase/epimerase